MNKPVKLREMAARYRYLMTCTNDEAVIEILGTLSRKCEEEAQQVERENASERAA
jgi:hypothetical protein